MEGTCVRDGCVLYSLEPMYQSCLTGGSTKIVSQGIRLTDRYTHMQSPTHYSSACVRRRFRWIAKSSFAPLFLSLSDSLSLLLPPSLASPYHPLSLLPRISLSLSVSAAQAGKQETTIRFFRLLIPELECFPDPRESGSDFLHLLLQPPAAFVSVLPANTGV